MDLKTYNVAIASDIGNFDGTVLDLAIFLRKRAITDLINMVKLQLTYDNGHFVDTGVTATDSPFQQKYEEGFEQKPEGEQALDELGSYDPSIPQTSADILDTNLGIKIGKFQNVITYFDNIIAANGVISSSSSTPAQDLITKFKELEGVYSTYGTFDVSTVYTTV